MTTPSQQTRLLLCVKEIQRNVERDVVLFEGKPVTEAARWIGSLAADVQALAMVVEKMIEQVQS